MNIPPIPQLIFFAFAGLTLLCALMVITQNNPVRCVLFLVVAFLSSSVIWMLTQAEFLALILVLVYVGAVMTLFLFVVMMLDIDSTSQRSHFVRYLPLGLIIAAVFVGLLVNALHPEVSLLTHLDKAKVVGENFSNTERLGLVLYTDYAYALEIAAVLLVVAIIAAITLAHRAPRECKTQDVVKQIQVKREDRIELIDMKPEVE